MLEGQVAFFALRRQRLAWASWVPRVLGGAPEGRGTELQHFCCTLVELRYLALPGRIFDITGQLSTVCTLEVNGNLTSQLADVM